jgi:hypothetical protein
MNYWILISAPDKWFCESCAENAKVNETLLNLNEQSWSVREDYFKNAEINDECIIKVGKDKRSIERRTLDNGDVVDVLESGIYALGKISKELYFDEVDHCHRIVIKITQNLFKENSIIDADMAEKILGNDFTTQSSKKIDEEKYNQIVTQVNIIQNSNFNDIEENENTTIYPAEVKIQRDMFSVRELHTEYKSEMLVLAPDFQREFVWKLKQKSELIESILMGIPLPMIYFFESDNGVIQVVDGKQRLTSLFEYIENKFPLSQSLSILTNLKGKRYNELDPAERTKISRHQFVAQTIIPPTPDRIKFDIFERVNRKGSILNNQEMRNALYHGESTKLLDILAEEECFKQATGEGVSPTRMRDRYMILRFLAFYLWNTKQLIDVKKNELVEYKSDIDEFVGQTMTYLNRTTSEKREEIKKIFKQAMSLAYDIGGENIFRLPNHERKRPISVTLFESFSYFFSQIKNEPNQYPLYREKLKQLLLDEEYLDALTSNVDSTTGVTVRFKKIDALLEGMR